MEAQYFKWESWRHVALISQETRWKRNLLFQLGQTLLCRLPKVADRRSLYRFRYATLFLFTRLFICPTWKLWPREINVKEREYCRAKNLKEIVGINESVGLWSVSNGANPPASVDEISQSEMDGIRGRRVGPDPFILAEGYTPLACYKPLEPAGSFA